MGPGGERMTAHDAGSELDFTDTDDLRLVRPYACRVCGCTEFDGCPGVQGGCYWVDTDDSGENFGPLCSECAPERLEPCQC